MAESDMKKMATEIWKSVDVKIEKKKEFHCSKMVIYVNNLDVKKLLVSDKFAYGKNKETNVKYFIRYKKLKKLDH